MSLKQCHTGQVNKRNSSAIVMIRVKTVHTEKRLFQTVLRVSSVF